MPPRTTSPALRYSTAQQLRWFGPQIAGDDRHDFFSWGAVVPAPAAPPSPPSPPVSPAAPWPGSPAFAAPPSRPAPRPAAPPSVLPGGCPAALPAPLVAAGAIPSGSSDGGCSSG